MNANPPTSTSKPTRIRSGNPMLKILSCGIDLATIASTAVCNIKTARIGSAMRSANTKAVFNIAPTECANPCSSNAAAGRCEKLATSAENICSTPPTSTKETTASIIKPCPRMSVWEPEAGSSIEGRARLICCPMSVPAIWQATSGILIRNPIVAPSANSIPRRISNPTPPCAMLVIAGMIDQTARPKVKVIAIRIIFGSAGDARTGAVTTSPPTRAMITNNAIREPTSGCVMVSS